MHSSNNNLQDELNGWVLGNVIEDEEGVQQFEYSKQFETDGDTYRVLIFVERDAPDCYGGILNFERDGPHIDPLAKFTDRSLEEATEYVENWVEKDDEWVEKATSSCQ